MMQIEKSECLKCFLEYENHILNMKSLIIDKPLNQLEDELSNIQRNSCITIYKDLQRKSPTCIHKMIQSIISKMADQQRIVKYKKTEKGSDQLALKQISTIEEINDNSLMNSLKEIQKIYELQDILIFNKLIPALIKYQTEIQERQFDGQINNALMMIQQEKYEKSEYNPMCVSTALFHSINAENSKKNQFKPIKIAYINLTMNDSIQNVELWHKCTQNSKNMAAYFSIFHNNCKDYETLKRYSRFPQIYLFPIEPPKKETLNRMQLRNIFKNCIRIPLEQFNPQMILLSISFNYDHKIDLQELQNLVRKLCQMSNNKLTIHINFNEFIESTPSETMQDDFRQLINCVYQGMQLIRIPKQLEIFGDLTNIQDWFNQTSKYFLDYLQSDNAKTFQRYANVLSVMKPKLRNERKDITNEFLEGNYEKFIGCAYRNKFILFEVKHRNQPIYFNKTTKIFVNHEESLLAIYHEKNRKAFYGDLTQLETCNFVDVYQIQNLPELINPSILITQNYIIIAYGYMEVKRGSELSIEFNSSIYSFNYKDKKLVEYKENRVNENQDLFQSLYFPSKKNQNQFDQKNQIKWIYSRDYQHLRQNPGVAKRSFLNNDNNTINFMLIGGEGYKGINQIQNIIECIQLNLNTKTYISGTIDKVSLHRFPTFKPFPYQIILDSEIKNVEKRFIILPGNLNMFQDYYKQPINQSYAEKATMIVVSQKDNIQGIDISEVIIQYNSGNLLNVPISMLLNNQNNFQITQCDEDQITWCLNSQAISYYPKLIKVKPDFIYQHENSQQIQTEQTGFEDDLMEAGNLVDVIELDKNKAIGQVIFGGNNKQIDQEKKQNSEFYMENSIINQSILYNSYFIIKFELQLKTNILNITEITVQDNSYLEIDTSQYNQNK